MYVADKAALDSFSSDLRDALVADPRLAVDTEFIRERSYYPMLEVVQVAADNGNLVAVLDVPALRGDLGEIADIFRDESVLKILHAGSQDMEILAALLGQPPLPVFDTQVGAAFGGYALQMGYGALVYSVLGVTLAKDEGYADWSRRPLTSAMLTYAENDVRYLHSLHDRLTDTLTRRGRLFWAEEQMRRGLLASAEPPAPEDLWQKVSGKQGLNGMQLAVLRELAIWRDEEAQRRDKPRRTIIKDDPLIEVAKRGPRTAKDVMELRGMPPNLGEKAAGDIAERVKRGQATPPDQRPRLELPPSLDDEGANLMELLSAVVRIRAQQEGLPAPLLASGDELRAFAGSRKAKERYDGTLFQGWKGEILGNDLKETLEGRKTVAWDAKRGRLHLLELSDTGVVSAEEAASP